MLNHRRREWGRSVPRLFCPAPAGRRFSALRLEDRRQRGDDFPRGASSGKPGAFPRSAVGSRSRTEQPCHTLCETLPRSPIGPGLPGAVRPAELIRPASGARHGGGAFTTDLRGGLSQWHGGRLGSFDPWYGPGTASAVVCLFVDIAPALNNLMSAVCSRPVLAPACPIRLSLIFTRPLFELTFQPGNRFMIARSPGQPRSRSTRCIQPSPRHPSSGRPARS